MRIKFRQRMFPRKFLEKQSAYSRQIFLSTLKLCDTLVCLLSWLEIGVFGSYFFLSVCGACVHISTVNSIIKWDFSASLCMLPISQSHCLSFVFRHYVTISFNMMNIYLKKSATLLVTSSCLSFASQKYLSEFQNKPFCCIPISCCGFG